MRPEFLMPHWNEGMLVRPQHFQSLSRFLENQLHFFNREQTPYYWGIRRLEISSDEVGNRTFSIRSGSLVLRDGTQILIPDETEIAPREFSAALDESDGPLMVYLGIPLRMHRVAAVGSKASARYRLFEAECADDNRPENAESIQYRCYNARLLFSTEDISGFETLPVARIRRSSEDGGNPELDPAFCPPCTDVKALPALRNILTDTMHLLSGKARDLSQQLVSRRVSFSAESGEPENLLKLSVANANLPVLRQLVSMTSVHPFTVFMALARLIGELSIFSPERIVPELKPYDHDDPGGSLSDLLAVLRELWRGEDTRYFESRGFNKVAEGLTLELNEGWLEKELEFYLGVESPADADSVCMVMKKYIRLGELSSMNDMKRFNVLGLERVYTKAPPRELPNREHLHYFRLDRKGTYWDGIKEKRNLTLGYLGESEEQVVTQLKAKGSAQELFKLYVVLAP